MAVAKRTAKAGSNGLINTVLHRQAGLGEDIFLFAASLLICAFYQMENYRLNVDNIKSMPDLSGLSALFALPASWLLAYGMQLFRAGFAVLFVMTLLSLSFSNGILRRWGFPAAVATLLLLPQLGLSLLNTTRQGDGLLRFLQELSVMLGQWPFVMPQKLLAHTFALSVGLPVVAALSLVACAAMFALGYFVSHDGQKR